jgi:hypothetical protein
MGLRQAFRFSFKSDEDVRGILRTLSHSAVVEDRGDFFVFTQQPGQPRYSFDCSLVPEGLHSDRTGQFGRVEVEDI